MKRLASAILASVCVVGVARADDTAAALVLDERSDAWLHEHCAYRGLTGPHGDGASVVAGRVLESIGELGTKSFLCVERPPFWKGEWTPAPPDAVACTETPKPRVCVPPLVPKVAAPAAAPADGTKAEAKPAPPSMPEPDPPRPRVKRVRPRKPKRAAGSHPRGGARG